MSEHSAAPLAQFLIDRNKELEAQVQELQESSDSADKLDTSLRYTRCLLTNYAEMHKDASDVMDVIKHQTSTIRIKLIVGIILILLPFILHGGGLTGTNNKPLVWTFGLGMLSALGWIIYDINVDLNAIRQSIRKHAHDVETVKRSNHLFPDIVDNLPRSHPDE